MITDLKIGMSIVIFGLGLCSCVVAVCRAVARGVGGPGPQHKSAVPWSQGQEARFPGPARRNRTGRGCDGDGRRDLVASTQ